ncbi:hypothetical protein R1sor_021097 [Riccia sorocarpa]|uniref:Uncharacterized protein n=1 Tax=Riccia sorocarpa TaxID=122646 RepID=A0ABD3GHJ6_9MARC
MGQTRLRQEVEKTLAKLMEKQTATSEGMETAEHLLWLCLHTRLKWNDLRYITEGLQCHIPLKPSFIDAFDYAFQNQSPSRYTMFNEMTRTVWRERNEATFTRHRRSVPLSLILTKSLDVITVQRRRCDQDSQTYRCLSEAEQILMRAKQRYSMCKTEVEDGEISEPPLSATGAQTDDPSQRNGERRSHGSLYNAADSSTTPQYTERPPLATNSNAANDLPASPHRPPLDTRAFSSIIHPAMAPRTLND